MKIHRLNHRDIPLEWFLLQRQLHLLEQYQRPEYEAAMETDRNQPACFVRSARTQSFMVLDLCHNRITSRLTC
jgi:hypothetical protein